MEFCIFCNKSMFDGHKCSYFVVNLDDEWGMARRSDAWQKAEAALRDVVCAEYGHAFFPGGYYTWKTYCRRCMEPNPNIEDETIGIN